MTITYKKRSIKKARTKKKVFGNKKQTYKRSKNKWSIRRKRGGMDKVKDPEEAKKQKIGSPEGSPVLAPAGAMQVDSPPRSGDSPSTPSGALLGHAQVDLPSASLGFRQFDVPSAQPDALPGAPQPGEQTSTSLDVLQVPLPSTPPGAPLGAPPPTETDDLCEDDLKMVNKLLDDINDDDVNGLDHAEIDNLIAVTDLTDLDADVTGDQSDGFLEAGDPPKTPPARRITRHQVIERLKQLLTRPQKLARHAVLTGSPVPRMPSLSQEGSQSNPSSAPASSAASSAHPTASSSAARARARATGLSPLLAVSGTPQLATSCSNANFLEVLVIYLNIKKKRWGLSTSSLANCWENLFIMYEKRGFKKGFGDRIVEYSTSRLFDQTSFSRSVFQQFVIDCVDFGVAEEMKLVKNVGRDAFAGEQLKSACVQVQEAKGGFLYTSPEHVPAGVQKKKLNKKEVDWIKKCIINRTQLWIDNPELRKDDGGPDYERSKQDMKERINGDYNSWTYWKQVCGICWICKKPIYFYYMTENPDGSGQKIDLNTQCGQIEHVLPPTVGDTFGTLHTSASTFKKVVQVDGKTMYIFGLEPSHAFCNQMKGMFVFTPIFFGGNVKPEWSREVDSWFSSQRYDSFEFYPGFINSWNPSDSRDERDIYLNTTYHNVNEYLKQNIIPILREQAAHPGHTIKSVTQLKLAIFCQKFAYEHSGIFKTKWDGKDSSGAARGTPGGI
jgi:hypothetical protein